MGREEGGGFRMGNTCIPVADSFWYMAKPIQHCKVKKKLAHLGQSGQGVDPDQVEPRWPWEGLSFHP